MARKITITPNKTYATEANAVKAVEKVFPDDANDGLRYIMMRGDDGRFFPLFVGERSMQHGAHFHFCVTF